MAPQSVHLRQFKDGELILDDEDTRAVLKFFFPADQSLIREAVINRTLRNLAQALLVEAIDASFAMGWIEQTFRWAANPGSGVKRAMRKLATRAMVHWFKHARRQNLMDAKIYESVRDQLSRSFRFVLHSLLIARNATDSMLMPGALVRFGSPTMFDKLWG